MPRGRPFPPGNHCGRGRPLGSRNKKTVLAQLLDSHAEALVRKALALADEGDSQMLRFLLGRILPPTENAPPQTGPLPMGSAAELTQSSQKLLQKVTSGEVNLRDASGITDLMEHHRHYLETENLEIRVRALEQEVTSDDGHK
jgi:hypothetical protein